jgi:hypothetical protein
MVPFSFKSELSYSRVIMKQLMVESLELRAASVTSVTLDPIVGTGSRAKNAKDCEGGSTRGHGSMLSIIDRHAGTPPDSQLQTLNSQLLQNPNEFAKIQVNPTKSNQIRPLFLWESRDERQGQRGAGPNCGGMALRLCASVANHLFFKKVKTTKRTQFEKCKSPIKH